MSPRKRKHGSLDSETEKTLSKRARLLSNLWQSQEESVGTTQGSQSSPSSSLYRIKSIIGERSTEYLIDWADDPTTGARFKPDWVSTDIRHVFMDSILALVIQLLASLVSANCPIAT